jgi:nucleotide-binding universal stress UspA family protein
MFRRVLVPLDGSERAERALPLATRLASAPGGSLVLLDVVPQSASASISFDIVDPREDLRREARGYLRAVAGRPELASVTAQTRVVIGLPADEILSAARGDGVDVIVMCSHGRTGFAKWAMGSVAQKVAHHSAVPVLVLKQGIGTRLAFTAPQATSLRILIPLDGSSLAEAALAPALDLLTALGPSESAEVHLLRVVNPTIAYDPVDHQAYQDRTVRAALTESAYAYLTATAGRVRRQLLETHPQAKVSWSVIVDDSPAAIITAAASGRAARGSDEPKMPFDVVAMATHGHGVMGLRGVGSVTERVLTFTSSPILIVRPPHEPDHTEVSVDAHEIPTFPPLL